MPGMIALQPPQDDSTLEEIPEIAKLWMPSSIPLAQQSSLCMPGLADRELRLRYGQADDALAELRRLRRMFRGMLDQHKKHVAGTSQRMVTRAKAVFDGFRVRIQCTADRYRDARYAVQQLDPNEEKLPWKAWFLVLRKEDVRGPGREDETESQGRYQPSWIWLVPPSPIPPFILGVDPSDTPSSTPTLPLPETPMSADEVQDCMRVEWTKQMARARRYEEEVILLVDEMRRTLTFLLKKAEWWKAQANRRHEDSDITSPCTPLLTDAVRRGLQAYAQRQAAIREALVRRFASQWINYLNTKDLGADWVSEFDCYVTAHAPSTSAIPTRDEDIYEGTHTDKADYNNNVGGDYSEDLDIVATNDVLLQALEDSLAHG